MQINIDDLIIFKQIYFIFKCVDISNIEQIIFSTLKNLKF